MCVNTSAAITWKSNRLGPGRSRRVPPPLQTANPCHDGTARRAISLAYVDDSELNAPASGERDQALWTQTRVPAALAVSPVDRPNPVSDRFVPPAAVRKESDGVGVLIDIRHGPSLEFKTDVIHGHVVTESGSRDTND